MEVKTAYKVITWQSGTTPEGKAIRSSQTFMFPVTEVYLASALRRCKDWLEQNRGESWDKGIKTLLIEHGKAEAPKKHEKGFPVVDFTGGVATTIAAPPTPTWLFGEPTWLFGEEDVCWYFDKATCPKPEKKTKEEIFDLLSVDSSIKERAKLQRLNREGGWLEVGKVFQTGN